MDKLEIQTVTESGAPVRRRITSPATAHAVYDRMRRADEQGDAKRRAILQGMNDGNPPYSASELKQMGLAHMTNVNFLTMRANLDARAGAGHELFAEVPQLVDVHPRTTVEAYPEMHLHCRIVSEEFSDLVTSWDGFLSEMEMIWRDKDLYGFGTAVWRDGWDWRIAAYKRGSVLVAPQAKTDVNANDIICVRDRMPIYDIMAKLEDEDAARTAGWKTGNLKDLLIERFHENGNERGEDSYQRSSFESIQQMMRNGEPLYEEAQFDAIRVVHIFVREVSGERGITHLIIPERSVNQVFLYERPEAYKRMSEAVWWMPYNHGDGYITSVRGVASYMAPLDDLSNRFLGRTFDAGYLTASLLLQPETQMDLSRAQITQFGPYTFIPPDIRIHQSTFQPQLQPLIALRNVSEQVMKNNTGTYRQHSEGFDREQMKTARQVMEETSKEARFEKNSVAYAYQCLDKLYREMFRRVVRLLDEGDEFFSGYDSAKEFLGRCEARGVEKKFIMDWEKNFRLVAYRAIGLGSLGVRYDITQQVLNVSGQLDQAGQREATREFLAARVGYRHVDRFMPKVDRDQIPSNEASIAMLEFNDVEEGSQVIVGTDQLHKTHIMVFAQRLGPLVQAAQSGQVQDPITATRTMQLAMEHMQQHAQVLAQDPRQQQYLKQEFQPLMQELGKVLTLLQAEARRAVHAQQQQQAEQQETLANAQQVLADRELEAKIHEINQKAELERMKQQSLNDMRQQKTTEQMNIRREQTQQGMALKQAEVEADIRRKDRESAAKINREINR